MILDALKPDPAVFELEAAHLLLGLFGMLDKVMRTGQPIDRRQSTALATERLTLAIADMARALTTFRCQNEQQCLDDLLTLEALIARRPASIGIEAEQKTLQQTAIPMPASNCAEIDSPHHSAFQIDAVQPTARRRRGAQPGNQHAVTHGRFTRAAKAERAAFRASLRRVKQLKSEARVLATERGRLAAMAKASG